MALVMVVGLGGCAARPAVWQKAGAGDREQSADLSQCRSYAVREAEREYVRDRAYSSDGAFGGQGAYQRNMDAYRVGISQTELLARCMKLKGYRQVPSGTGPLTY